METQVLAASGPSCDPGITGPQIPRRNKRTKGSEQLADESQLDCDCGISVCTQRTKQAHNSSFGRLTMLLYCVRVVATVGSTSGTHFRRPYKSSPLTKTGSLGVWGARLSPFGIRDISLNATY